jgi:hypothetical protein
MLSVILLNVVLLNAIMLSVVAPRSDLDNVLKFKLFLSFNRYFQCLDLKNKLIGSSC